MALSGLELILFEDSNVYFMTLSLYLEVYVMGRLPVVNLTTVYKLSFLSPDSVTDGEL
jgi:hypothetical protein